jgi:hypothetical protein
MKNLRWPLSALILPLLCSCAIAIRMPSNRFETSEATGGSGGVLWDVTAANRAEVVLTDDYSLTAPNTTQPALRSTNVAGFNLGLSVVERLELKLRDFNTLSAKFQLIGPSKAKAKAGDLSAALYASGKINSSEGSAGGFSYQLSDHHYDGMAIVGFRLSDPLLAYGGVFRTLADFDGSRTPTGGSAVAFAGTGTNTGASAGFELGTGKLRLIAEGSLNLLESGSSSRRIYNGGFALEYHGF